MVTDEAFETATRRGEEMRRTTPWAVRARYDRRARRIVVRLSSGMDLSFSPKDAQGLEHATPEQLAEVVILGVGYGLHWESLDADLHVPALLQGVTGTAAWMARRARAQAA